MELRDETQSDWRPIVVDSDRHKSLPTYTTGGAYSCAKISDSDTSGDGNPRRLAAAAVEQRQRGGRLNTDIGNCQTNPSSSSRPISGSNKFRGQRPFRLSPPSVWGLWIDYIGANELWIGLVL